MNIKVGDTIELIHHMSNKGKVLKVYYVPVTAGSAAGSFSKMMTADFVVSLSRKIEDKLAGTGRWHVIKNRFGPDGMTFPSKANFSTGQIHIYNDDSIDGKRTTNQMKQGESLVRKNLLQTLKVLTGLKLIQI